MPKTSPWLDAAWAQQGPGAGGAGHQDHPVPQTLWKQHPCRRLREKPSPEEPVAEPPCLDPGVALSGPWASSLV